MNIKNLLLIVTILFCNSKDLFAQLALDLAGTGNYAETYYTLNETGFTVEYDMYMHSLQDYNAGLTFTTNGTANPIDLYFPVDGNCSFFLGDGITSNGGNIGTGGFVTSQWYTITYVYSNVFHTLTVYIDGNFVYQTTLYYSASFGSPFFRIGTRADDFTNANAKYDNVRIWNTTRTQSQISQDATTCFTGNEPGLDILYVMEEGSGTTLNDLALGNGAQNATIIGTVTWTAGKIIYAQGNTITASTCDTYTSPSGNHTWSATGTYVDTIPATNGCDSIVTINLTNNSFNPTITNNGNGTLTSSSATGNQWINCADNSLISSATNQNYTVASTNDYAVIVTNSFGCVDTSSCVHISIDPAKSLNFELGDKVNLGTSLIDELDGLTSFTIEAMVKTSSITGTGCIFGNYNTGVDGNFNILLRRNDNLKYFFYIQTSTGAGAINSTPVMLQNEWQHVAGVWDGSNMTLYIDGVNVGSSLLIGTMSSASSSNPFFIGGNILNENFEGSLDEIRVWSTVKTQSDIIDNAGCELNGDEPGLLRYYNFNQGVEGQNNTSVDTLIDLSVNNNTGTLTGFTLAGATSNWRADTEINTKSDEPVIANQTFCTAQFSDVVIPNSTIKWYSASTGGTMYSSSDAIPATNIYYATATDGTNCESHRVPVILTIDPVLNTMAIDNGDLTITSSSATGNQWINCTTNTAIGGATSQTYTATANGSYAVIVTNASGCSDTSACVMIGNVGIENLDSFEFAVYPNPTMNTVMIEFNGSMTTVQLLDMNGKQLLSSEIKSGSTLDLTNFEKGVYFLKMNNKIERLIKL